FFFQAEDGIRDFHVTGVQTCALPISMKTPNLFLLLVALLAFSCNREKDPLDEKKANLETYKKESSELNAKIVALEKEIASMDPRSEERRVGKECGSRGAAGDETRRGR